VLSAAGVPCGHESVYGPAGGDWGGWRADASWLGAARLPLPGVRVAHQVRDPIAVVGSLLGSSWLSGRPGSDPYRAVAHRAVPGLAAAGSDIEAALLFWCEWTELIDRHAEARWRVEDVGEPDTAAGIGALVGLEGGAIAAAAARVPADVNSRPSPGSVVLASAPAGLRARLIAGAERYGYMPFGENASPWPSEDGRIISPARER
jgi:hypothetical protein